MYNDLQGVFKWCAAMQPILAKDHIPLKVDCYIKAGRVTACVLDLRGTRSQCLLTISAISASRPIQSEGYLQAERNDG